MTAANALSAVQPHRTRSARRFMVVTSRLVAKKKRLQLDQTRTLVLGKVRQAPGQLGELGIEPHELLPAQAHRALPAEILEQLEILEIRLHPARDVPRGAGA